MLPDKEALKQQLYLRQVRTLSSRTKTAFVAPVCFPFAPQLLITVIDTRLITLSILSWLACRTMKAVDPSPILKHQTVRPGLHGQPAESRDRQDRLLVDQPVLPYLCARLAGQRAPGC